MNIEDIRHRIQDSTYEEICNTIIEEGRVGFYKNGKGQRIYTIPKEDLDDIKRTVDETKLLLEMREDKRNINHRREDAEATSLGSSNYYNLDNFNEKEETPEEREERRNKERARRKVQREGDKRDLKKHAKAQKKAKRMKEKADKKGNKKLKNRIIAIMLSGVAITSAVQGIAAIQTDAKEYNETAASVEGKDINEIYDEAEKEFKNRIAQSEGISPEEVNFSIKQIDSSMEIYKIEAGDKKIEIHEDRRSGVNPKRNISNLIKAIKERPEDIRNSINTLSKARNIEISFDDEKSTNDTVEKQSTKDTPEKEIGE